MSMTSARLPRPLIVMLLSSAVSLAAAQSGTGEANVVAQAGSISLSDSDVRAIVATLPPAEKAAASADLNALEQVVHADLVRRAVLAEAKARGFEQQPSTSAQLAEAHDETLVRLWIAAKATVPADYPSQAEVQAVYSSNQQQLAAPTQYRLAQIFIRAPDGADPTQLAVSIRKAADISNRIATADFGQLAEQQSDDAQSARRLQPAILAAIRNLKPGEVVGPVKTSEGLHFLKLEDLKPGAVPSLAEAHDRIVALLRARRAQELMQTYLNQYNAKLGVTINQIELARIQQTLPR
jgi:peptidylprolyl isomerase